MLIQFAIYRYLFTFFRDYSGSVVRCILLISLNWCLTCFQSAIYWNLFEENSEGIKIIIIGNIIIIGALPSVQS